MMYLMSAHVDAKISALAQNVILSITEQLCLKFLYYECSRGLDVSLHSFEGVRSGIWNLVWNTSKISFENFRCLMSQICPSEIYPDMIHYTDILYLLWIS